MHERIHIALAFDENYVSQFYAVTTSIFQNNPHNAITVHAIVSGVAEQEKQDIIAYLDSYGGEMRFYQAPEKFGQHFRLDGNWTAAAYYRLLFPELLPAAVHRYLYIDTDTLVVGDLRELWSVSLDAHVVAAVRDRLIVTRPDLGITQPYSYFNSGVLLINLILWQEQNITQRAIDFLNTYPEKVLYADQDALNYLLKDAWYPLDTRFNLMYADIPEDLPRKQFGTYLQKQVILHFTQHRPWKMLCENRFRYLYHHYLSLSPASRRGPKYTDYALTVGNLIKLLRIRLRELYFDNPTFAGRWRDIKPFFWSKA